MKSKGALAEFHRVARSMFRHGKALGAIRLFQINVEGKGSERETADLGNTIKRQRETKIAGMLRQNAAPENRFRCAASNDEQTNFAGN